MKKVIFFLLIVACLMAAPIGLLAYTVTITDSNQDAIGHDYFETTSITYNIDEYPFAVDIATIYTLAGKKVGDWQTLPADLLFDGGGDGVWDYAIPLVTHGSFTAGQLYEVISLAISDDYEPITGSYTYNHDQPVWLKEGTDTGYGGSWTGTSGHITYQADGWNFADGVLTIQWATGTCANDVIVGTSYPVPEPASLMLFGLGLVGLAGIGRKMKK